MRIDYVVICTCICADCGGVFVAERRAEVDALVGFRWCDAADFLVRAYFLEQAILLFLWTLGAVF